MRACWCTLAGTRACLFCPNNGSFIPGPYWFPIAPHRISTYTTTTTTSSDNKKDSIKEERFEPQIGYDQDFIKDNRDGKYYDSFDIADKLNYYDEENKKLRKALMKSLEKKIESEKELEKHKNNSRDDNDVK